VFGSGYILAGLFGNSFIDQVIFIGIIAGAGLGLTYVCPISVGMKWFPDKKGFITGLIVAGFGFGALIWVKLAGSWGGLLESLGVLNVFLIYGIVFAAVIIIGSIWMVNPPEGWKPVSSSNRSGAAVNADSKLAHTVDFSPADMLRRPQFYGLWLMFVFSSMAGLLTIGNIKLFGIEVLSRNGLTTAHASAVAGTAMAVFCSTGNGLGRIIWGSISDKAGHRATLTLMFMLQGVTMLVFYWMVGNKYLLYLGAAVIGFNFGGSFSLFPTSTADLFGARNMARNYGWIFTAHGVGGIIGPIMAGIIRDAWQNWLAAFIICGVACLVAAGIGLSLKPPVSIVGDESL